uniref:Uncharacterized protein n=1 Tax=Arundo donax TaxID=35708 RepID=A0A0A9DID4_ARUDO
MCNLDGETQWIFFRQDGLVRHCHVRSTHGSIRTFYLTDHKIDCLYFPMSLM